MTGLTVTDADSELNQFQLHLHEHFSRLGEQRADANAPVFALEHGLDVSATERLNAAVRESVREGKVDGDNWIAYVVYATEVGYHYSGDEYWPGFESRTDGWTKHGNREWIRKWFRDFERTFGGVRPRGPWAETFSIISHPISHAILPADLQRQLARLLYENSGYLGPELLDDTTRLGESLAARAWSYSSRFEAFCENTAILGRVASALLINTGDDSPYISGLALRRIVKDLSAERQAHAWLESARMTAARIRLTGGASARSSGSDGESNSPIPAGRIAPLRVKPLIRRDGSSWRMYVEFPDLMPLLEVAPSLAEELKSRRTFTPFAPDRPLPSGRLMFPPQRVRVTAWPSPDTPAIAIEGGSEFSNSVLAAQLVKPIGDRWLFETTAEGEGIEVRSGRVRGGRDYLLLSKEDLPTRRPAWISEVDSVCEGMLAYSISAPTAISAEEAVQLDGADLAFGIQADVFPVGAPPIEWDGDGYASWLSTEEPTLGIRSTVELARVVWEVDGESTSLAWPKSESTMFVVLGDLAIGSHSVRVSLVRTGDAEPFGSTDFEVNIRDSGVSLESGSRQEGLMILPSPAQPTLSQLWEGRAEVQVLGPGGSSARVELQLRDQYGKPLETRSWTLPLPISIDKWRDWFTEHVRPNAALQSAYDRAESCAITVARDELGRVELECDREFTALRWVCIRNRSKRIMKLIDNTDSMRSRVRIYPFATPDRSIDSEPEGGEVRVEKGGLVVASTETLQVSMIAPRTETKFQTLGALSVDPTLGPTHKSKDAVLELLRVAALWWSAPVTADPDALSAKEAVLSAIRSRTSQVLGGISWTSFETDYLLTGVAYPPAALQVALGDKLEARRLAPRLEQLGVDADGLDETAQAMLLARALADYAPRCGVRAADVDVVAGMSRLARNPGEVTDAGLADSLVGLALEHPLVFCAARFLAAKSEASSMSFLEAIEAGGDRWK